MELVLSRADLEQMPADLRAGLLAYLLGEVGGQEAEAHEGRSITINGFRYVDLEGGRGFDSKRSVVALTYDQAGKLFDLMMKRVNRDAHLNAQFDAGPFGILNNLAYVDDADAPTPAHIAEELGLEDPKRLGPYIGSIHSLLRSRKMTGNRDASLCRLDSKKGVYVVHPETRQALRQVRDEGLPERWEKCHGEEPPPGD